MSTLQFRPLLGAKLEEQDLYRLRFPLYASPKLDGIRAIWYGSEFLSRTLKTIPNRGVQRAFAGEDLQSGWDGELIVGDPTTDPYRRTESKVMTIQGDAQDVTFFTFDNCEATGGFSDRIRTLADRGSKVVVLPQRLVSNLDELLRVEEEHLREGYEGLVLRAPSGPYKYGRSTLREQYLLKLKRFTDAEAIIVDFEELLQNANTAESDERGYTKRSGHQENLIPMGVLGAFVVSMGTIQFNIGTGFTPKERSEYWRGRDRLKGRLVKFKHFAKGSKDKPRHPVFLGFRDPIDM